MNTIAYGFMIWFLSMIFNFHGYAPCTYDENYHANDFFICLSFNLFIIINKPLNCLHRSGFCLQNALHIKGIPHQFSIWSIVTYQPRAEITVLIHLLVELELELFIRLQSCPVQGLQSQWYEKTSINMIHMIWSRSTVESRLKGVLISFKRFIISWWWS
jgi:hypothetical protein